MLTAARTRIDRWLGQLLAAAGEGDNVGLVLLHAAVDQSQRTVKSWRLAEAVGNLEALVNEIDEVAEEDAEGLGGRQRYVLRAIAKGKEVGSLTLRYEHRPEDGPAVDSEPATAAGTIALLQRHAEGAMRMMVQSFGGVIESYKEQVNAQKALIGEFQKQAAENFKLQEELASRKLERELVVAERETSLQLEAAREASKIKKSDMLWVTGLTKLFEIGPVVLHLLTKGQVGQAPAEFVASREADKEAQLFENVDDATIERWRDSMSPAQFAAVMERLQAFRARNQAKTEAKGSADAVTASPPGAEIDDAEIAAAARRFYEALCERPTGLEALAMAYLTKQDLEALGPDQRQLVSSLAAAALPDAVGDVASPALWTALLSSEPASLLPLVDLVRSGVPWSQVSQDPKIQLMALVRRVYRIVAGEGASTAAQ